MHFSGYFSWSFCVSKETNNIFEDIWAQVDHFEEKWPFRVMKRFLRVKHEIASVVAMQ